jgi:hypothetical protein
VILSKLIRPFTSAGLIAVLLFVALSLWVGKTMPQIMNPETKQGFNVLVTAYLKKMVYYFYANEPDDVLVLGSSVVLNPSCHADIRYERRSKSITWMEYNSFTEDYIHAKSFEHSLRDVFGQPVSAVNLALPSAVMQDNTFLLKKLIAMHRKPSLIVLGLSPRDFLVNLTGTQGPTITEEVLDIFQPLPFSTAWFGDSPAVFFKSLFVFQQALTVDSMSEQRNLLKRSMKNTFDEKWARLSQRLLTGYWAPACDKTPFYQADGYIDAPVNFADLKNFPNIYSDLTRPFLEKQLLAFEQLLKSAQEENITVFVASMPISAPNKALFHGSVPDRYQIRVHELIDKYGATLWVADERGTWPLKYFHDSVHLNAAGGQLFFWRLARELSKNAKTAQCVLKNAHGVQLSSTTQTH